MLEDKSLNATSIQEAVQLIHAAATFHVPQAEHLIGVMHEYGLGVPMNHIKALQAYESAAYRGHVESVYHLALMHAYGRGTSQNYQLAASLFQQASDRGHFGAAYYMVMILVFISLLPF